MAAGNVFRWKEGNGWLVLSGGTGNASEIRAQVLGRASAEGGVAYISLNPEDDSVLDDMDDLGAPAGYLVDILREDDETIVKQLQESSIIVIQDSSDIISLLSALRGAAEQGLTLAYERGTIVLVEGLAAHLFGTWVIADTSEPISGLSWLAEGLILPGITSIADSEIAQQVLKANPTAIAVGIGSRSALALGPEQQLDVWGDREITVGLGSAYKSDDS